MAMMRVYNEVHESHANFLATKVATSLGGRVGIVVVCAIHGGCPAPHGGCPAPHCKKVLSVVLNKSVTIVDHRYSFQRVQLQCVRCSAIGVYEDGCALSRESGTTLWRVSRRPHSEVSDFSTTVETLERIPTDRQIR